MFSVEKMELYLCKVNVFIDEGRQILYCTCEGLNSFFSSETQQKILSNDRAKYMSVVPFSIKTFWIPG